MKHDNSVDPRVARRTMWKLRWIEAMKSEHYMWCAGAYFNWESHNLRKENCGMGVLYSLINEDRGLKYGTALPDGEYAYEMGLTQQEFVKLHDEVVEANDENNPEGTYAPVIAVVERLL